jgi:hypothetical protein
VYCAQHAGCNLCVRMCTLLTLLSAAYSVATNHDIQYTQYTNDNEDDDVLIATNTNTNTNTS